MKLHIKQTFSIILTTVLLFGVATEAHAESRRGESVTVGVDEVVNDDLFIGATTVDIAGVVNGDVYIGAQDVIISGEINGDLLIGAETIVITGVVNDDVRAAGRTLTLTGATINDGVMFFGDTLNLESGTGISGGVIFFGETLVMEALINGDLRGGADDAMISGEINDGVYLAGGELRIAETAVINGDVQYTSRNEPDIADGAVINGAISLEIYTLDEILKATEWVRVVFALYSFLAMLVTGLVLLAFFRRPVALVAGRINTKPLRTLAVGVLVMIGVFVAIPILLLTLIGIPLMLLLLAGFFMALYLSTIIVSISLGRFIIGSLRKDKTNEPSIFLSFFLGLVLLYMLYQLPYVEHVAEFVVTFLGVGAFSYGILQLRKKYTRN